MLKKLTDRKGFTLIELMIVIAIIGILAAIAIPQFTAYRDRAYNSSAKSDLRNLTGAQEAYYIEAGTYSNSVSQLKVTSYGLSTTTDVIMGGSAGLSGYSFSAYHSTGNQTYSVTGPGGTITQM